VANAMTGAKRTQRSTQKRKDAGLTQIKLWVVDEVEAKRKNPDLITEADKIRKYAAKQLMTKTIIGSL